LVSFYFFSFPLLSLCLSRAERFRTITSSYYRGHGIIVVYLPPLSHTSVHSCCTSLHSLYVIHTPLCLFFQGRTIPNHHFFILSGRSRYYCCLLAPSPVRLFTPLYVSSFPVHHSHTPSACFSRAEQFRTTTSSYYRGTHGLIVVYWPPLSHTSAHSRRTSFHSLYVIHSPHHSHPPPVYSLCMYVIHAICSLPCMSVHPHILFTPSCLFAPPIRRFPPLVHLFTSPVYLFTPSYIGSFPHMFLSSPQCRFRVVPI